MRMHTWASVKVAKNSAIWPCIFHAPYRGFGTALRILDLESGPVVYHLCETYIYVPSCWHPLPALCCEQIIIFNFQNGRGSLTRRGRLRRWSWTHPLLDLWKAQGLLRDFESANGWESWFKFRLISGLRASRGCHRNRTSLSEALRTWQWFWASP